MSKQFQQLDIFNDMGLPPISKSFYNTTHENSETLKEYTKKAQSQDVKVLELFRQFGKLTCSEAWRFFDSTFTPITSIRRSVNTLTKSGMLTKTSEKKVGLYGHFEMIYKLN